MSIYYCKNCKEAFLKITLTQKNGIAHCKKCSQALSVLAGEKGKVSLKAHIQAKQGTNLDSEVQTDKQYKTLHYPKPKHDQVLFDCESKLLLNPLNCDALYTLCNLYYSYGMTQESIAIAKQIIKIDSNFSKAHDFLARINPKSLTPNQLPTDISSLETIGLSKVNQKQYDDAIAIFQQILTISPKHPASHRYLAEIFTEKNQYNDAISHLNYLTLIFPDDYRVYYNLAVICYEMNDNKRAISNLNEAFKLCTDDDQFLTSIQSLITLIETQS